MRPLPCRLGKNGNGFRIRARTRFAFQLRGVGRLPTALGWLPRPTHVSAHFHRGGRGCVPFRISTVSSVWVMREFLRRGIGLLVKLGWVKPGAIHDCVAPTWPQATA